MSESSRPQNRVSEPAGRPLPPIRARPATSRSPVEIGQVALRAVRGLLAAPWNEFERQLVERGHRSPPPANRLPDFLGIGTPQSGTTWLFDKLVRHPDVFIPERKEMAFFYWERTELHKRLFGLHDYSGHYRDAGTRLKGDLTPNYSVLPDARIGYVARLMPDARLILVVRHPVERTWSAARRLFPRYFGRVPEDHEKIIDFLERESWIHAFSDYPTIIDAWERHFATSAMLTVGFDAIQREPEIALQSVFDHLGLTTPTDWGPYDLEARVNVNPEMAIPTEVDHYLAEKYAAVLERMRERGIDEPR